jgi:hypothetical protein
MADSCLEYYVGHLTWSRTLREEERMKLFENRVLRRKFGPEREDGED